MNRLILLIMLTMVGQFGVAQVKRGCNYSDPKLQFCYSPPPGMHDKTQRFKVQIQEQAKAEGTVKKLMALLAMSSDSDDRSPDWSSVTIETYPRESVSETDDIKAAGQMNAWVAHSNDFAALPKSVVISGNRFTASVFRLEEGNVKKGAVVFTTVRMGKLLSFAFAANNPDQLKALADTMKTVRFF